LTLAGATTITYFSRARLTGRLTDHASGAGIGGVPVTLWGQQATSTAWRTAGAATTTADGSVTFTPPVPVTTGYRLSFAGSSDAGTAASSPVTITVRPRVTARLAATVIRYGQTASVTGAVSPAHGGQRVYLQRLIRGRWYTTAVATLNGRSAYTLRTRPRARGRFTYRVLKGADSDHTTGTSPHLVLTVR
jgi:serine protease